MSDFEARAKEKAREVLLAVPIYSGLAAFVGGALWGAADLRARLAPLVERMTHSHGTSNTGCLACELERALKEGQ